MYKPSEYSVTADIVKKSKGILNKDSNLELNVSELDRISNSIKSANVVVDDIVELYPEIELVIEIMTSLIKSPNDTETESLIIDIKNNELPSEVKSNIISVIENHIDLEYNIYEKLDDIISESLYTKGSYVEINLPSLFVNDLIKSLKQNVKAGIESLDRTFNRINDEYNITIKDDNTGIEITDTLLNVCKQDVTVGNENKYYNKLFKTDLDISAGIESLMINDGIAIAEGYGLNDDNIDKPIIKKVSPNSIIPIASSEDPSKHYGYFYLTDRNGNSINSSDKDFSSNYNKEIISNIENTLGARDASYQNITNIDSLKEKLLLNNINKYLAKLKLNDIDVNVEISDEMILSIAELVINKTDVKIIYLPPELVSYYAINYRSNGTGKGLIERVAVLASIKGILTFTNLLSYIKSSVSTTEIKIDLDPEDPNYRQTIKKIVNEVIKNRQFSLPIRMLKVDDFIDWIHKLGYSVVAKHPDFPNVEIDVSENKNEIEPIDTELFEKLDKQILTALYCSPEIIDNSYNSDFATTVRQNFFLLNKRVNKLQKKYNKLITKDIRKKCLLDGNLIKKLEIIIKNNIRAIRRAIVKNNTNISTKDIKKITDEVIIRRVIFSILNNLDIALQKPVKVSEESIRENFNEYTDMLDSTIEKLLSSDALPSELIGDLSDNLDNIKHAIRIVMTRRYMANNKILPDLNNMFALDENGKPNLLLLDEFNDFVEVVKSIALPFVKESGKVVNKTNEKLEKINDSLDNEEEGEDSEENLDYTEEEDTTDEATDDTTGTDVDTEDTTETDETDTGTDVETDMVNEDTTETDENDTDTGDTTETDKDNA